MLVEVKKFGKEEKVAVTSLDIAETFGKEHKNVLRDIESLGCSEEFGKLNFERTYYIDSQNKKRPMYVMSRDGFTVLVMGYNGELAMKFKEAYINQFNAMEKELIGKRTERAKGIAVRQSLTDTIARVKENERMHGHAYSNYTNMIYKILFGKDAKQLREQYGIDKSEELRSCFTQDELQSIQDKEMLVNGLLAAGWGYDQIKDFMTNGLSNRKIAG